MNNQYLCVLILARYYLQADALVLCNTINTTWCCNTKVVVLTSKFGIVGINYAI